MKIMEYMKKHQLVQNQSGQRRNTREFIEDHKKIRAAIKRQPRTKDQIEMTYNLSETTARKHLDIMMWAGEVWVTWKKDRVRIYHWRNPK
jgi:hypothetical protein